MGYEALERASSGASCLPKRTGSRAGLGEKIEAAKTSFDAALDSVRVSALQIRKKLHDVQANEVEVKFGLKATGQFGNNMFAVGKAGVEANYELMLRSRCGIRVKFVHEQTTLGTIHRLFAQHI